MWKQTRERPLERVTIPLGGVRIGGEGEGGMLLGTRGRVRRSTRVYKIPIAD